MAKRKKSIPRKPRFKDLFGRSLHEYYLVEMIELFLINEDVRGQGTIGYFGNGDFAEVWRRHLKLDDYFSFSTRKVTMLTNGDVGYVLQGDAVVPVYIDTSALEKLTTVAKELIDPVLLRSVRQIACGELS
jgi:hypothetical protein